MNALGFMRMANLFGPQAQSTDTMPLPKPDEVINVPNEPVYGSDVPEQVNIGVEPTPLEAFRQSVLHPPEREHMTYPKSTLAGLEAALKIAAEPSPTSRNRVYVDGQAYQKGGVITDPKTGKQRIVTTVKDPSFMEQVLRAMPAAVSPAVDILNQPHADAVTDFELRNKGLKDVIGAESTMELARQRGARADTEPIRANATALNSQTRAYLASLNTMTDAEKIEALQAGRVSLEDLRAANQMKLQETKGTQAIDQIKARGEEQRKNTELQGGIQKSIQGMRGQQAMQQIGARGEEARKTKETPSPTSGATSQLPTQQKVQMQSNVTRVVNEHPEWKDYISFNEQGFPEIEAPGWFSGPTKEEYDQMFEAVYGTSKSDTNKPAPITTKPTTPKPTTAPKSAPKTSDTSGSVVMLTPDGKGVRLVPKDKIELAKSQGYTLKGKG